MPVLVAEQQGWSAFYSAEKSLKELLSGDIFLVVLTTLMKRKRFFVSDLFSSLSNSPSAPVSFKPFLKR